MADPVGFTAAVIGIAGLAWSSAQFLYQTLEDWKDAPDYSRSVKVEVLALSGILGRLKEVQASQNPDSSSQQKFFDDVLIPTLEEIDRACKKWSKKVEQHGRFIMTFKKKSFLQLGSILLNWKVTLDLALTSDIWCTKKEEALAQAKNKYMDQVKEASKAAEKADLEPPGPEEAAAIGDTASVLETSAKRVSTLGQQISIYQKISDVKAEGSSKALGADAVNEGEGSIKQDVDNLHAVKGSIALGALAHNEGSQGITQVVKGLYAEDNSQVIGSSANRKNFDPLQWLNS